MSLAKTCGHWRCRCCAIVSLPTSGRMPRDSVPSNSLAILLTPLLSNEGVWSSGAAKRHAARHGWVARWSCPPGSADMLTDVVRCQTMARLGVSARFFPHLHAECSYEAVQKLSLHFQFLLAVFCSASPRRLIFRGAHPRPKPISVKLFSFLDQFSWKSISLAL